MKFAGVVTGDRFGPCGIGRMQSHLRPLHRAVLRIMNKAADCSEDGGKGGQTAQQQTDQNQHSLVIHMLFSDAPGSCLVLVRAQERRS